MAVNEYNSMASYYDFVLEPVLWKMRKRIIELSNVKEGMKVLEVACGTGSQGNKFRKAGASYTGIDLSPAMLKVAQKHNLDCRHGDGTKLDIEDGYFDLSTITLALHEVKPEVSMKLVAEMLRVTRKDGNLILVDYTIPEKKTISGKWGNWIVYKIEKMVGGSHFRNYKKFMKAGGLVSFMKQFNIEIVETKIMFGGNLGIYSVRLIQE